MNESVLFVDDDERITRSIRRSMRKRPYRVLTASSGAEALEILEKEHVGVIVSDEEMPRMRGSELLRTVRDRYPSVVRVILTGQASMENTIAAINDAEIFRFLMKPVDAADVDLCIAHAIEARRQLIDRALASDEAQRHIELAHEFNRALEGVDMVFQPLVGAESLETEAFEALVRTDEPALARPDDLIRRAECLGRTLDLDRVIRAKVAARVHEVPEHCMLFVNLHPDSMSDPELTSSENPLLPWSDRIVLEVTERSSLEGETKALDEVLESLRSSGFRVAVDDLGAGYAGLTMFAQLRPEFVKFDMELIRHMPTSPTRAKLVRSMTHLCNELGIRTVAERGRDRGAASVCHRCGLRSRAGVLLRFADSRDLRGERAAGAGGTAGQGVNRLTLRLG